MIRYVAFLRGINVSGQKLIKMDELNRIFEGMKMANIKTLIQSGNVIFDAKEKDAGALKTKLEKGLHKALGYEVPVIVRTITEIEELVALDPFAGIKEEENVKIYIGFLSEEPKKKVEFPYLSKKQDVKILRLHNNVDAICLGLPQPDGRWGFPNAILEKDLGVAATTRNWNTVMKLLK